MRFVFALLATLALVSAKTHHSKPATEKELEQQFTHFIKTHNKKYTHDEFFPRFNTFKDNMEIIRKHNSNASADIKLGVNAFADLTWEEFRASKLGYNNIQHPHIRSKNAVKLSNLDAPTSVDWRTKGIVTPVKDQGQCGSCWAFSTTGSVEGAYAQKTGNLISLSEQQLVDCSTKQGNQGCNGGLMDYAFEYIISNKGITTESSYPYKAVDGSCKSGQKSAATITSYQDVPVGDEDSLLAAAAIQPVSVAIEADQSAFQLYSGGILKSGCGTNLDHGVLVVGYGTDAGTDYWLVKNSWGASWGESGYIRIKRDINLCGIAQSASYPIA